MKANSLDELVTNSNIAGELQNYTDWHTRLIKFAQLVADWQKEQDERVYREFFNERNQGDASFRDLLAYKEGHSDGMEEQASQMLKDAVGGEICGRVYDHINVRFADGVCKYLEPKNISHIPADVSKYNIGDKVRIVVIKEEEE